jgi:hypothetical protein
VNQKNGTRDGILQGTKTNGTRDGTLQGNTTVFILFVKYLSYGRVFRISVLVLSSLYFTLGIIILCYYNFCYKPKKKLRFELDSRQILVRFPTGSRVLTLLQSIPTSSGVIQPPYSMGIGESFPTGKEIGAKILIIVYIYCCG